MTDPGQSREDPVTRQQWEQAALWRVAAAARLRRARDELLEAEAGSPVSLERVKIGRALEIVSQALSLAESGAAQAARNAERVAGAVIQR